MFFENQGYLDTYNSGLLNENSNYSVLSGNYLSKNGITWDFLKTVVAPICPSDEIDGNYVNDKIDAVVLQTICDMAVIVDKRQFVMSNVALTASVKGFIITQRGECVKFPEVHSVSLICSKSEISGIGSIMLGAYLYMIKANNFNRVPALDNMQIGILDLAQSFYNVKAYCAYNKFGFQYNPDLRFYSNCYDPEDGLYNNLPMVVNVAFWPFDYALALVNQIQRLQKDPLCDLRGGEQLIESFIRKLITAKAAIELVAEPQVDSFRALGDSINRFSTKEIKKAYKTITNRYQFNPATHKNTKIILSFEQVIEDLRDNPDTQAKVLSILLEENIDRDQRREDKKSRNVVAENHAEPAGQRRFLRARTSARSNAISGAAPRLGGKRKSTRKSKRKPIKNKRKTRRNPIG
jgi:hypothetical protein